MNTTTLYDLRGLNCPMPVLKTRKRLSEMAAGETLIVETSDPLAVIDIPHFCKEHGHRMLACEAQNSGHRFTIVNGSKP